MPKRKNVSRSKTTIRRKESVMPAKYFVLGMICGLFLLAGFFAAANFHFRAVNTAMENSSLRLELNKLKDENRKLTVNRFKAASPKNIAALAAPMGFGVTGKPSEQPEFRVTEASVETESSKRVVKTVLSEPVAPKKKTKVVEKSKAPAADFVASLNDSEIGMETR